MTAGPTQEMMDPVRFISNFSTGELGYRLAEVARKMGHRVTLLTGPTFIQPPRNVRVLNFQSGDDLTQKLIREFKKADVLFMTAAICDYAPDKVAKKKIKRDRNISIHLKATPDILKKLIPHKKNQLTVGFCLETEHVAKHSLRKLKKKQLDYMIGNLLSSKSNPFGDRKTSVYVLMKGKRGFWIHNKSKKQIANFLVKNICR